MVTLRLGKYDTDFLWPSSGGKSNGSSVVLSHSNKVVNALSAVQGMFTCSACVKNVHAIKITSSKFTQIKYSASTEPYEKIIHNNWKV